MSILPVLSSLRRNSLAAALIALRVAVTLAVLCNALFIIQQRAAESHSLSGVGDEGDVFAVDIRWHGATAQISSRERTDLAALRSLPQVTDAVASIDHPLGGPTLGFTITLHPEQPASSLSTRKKNQLLAEIRLVLAKALTEGGTSFDSQYVNVNGQAGYFAHSLNAYGQDGKPCPRCGTPIVRVSFMNRSSHFCPRCQRVR